MGDMVQRMKELGIVATRQAKTLFRVDTEHGVVVYCSKHQKWQFHGRTLKGDLAVFKTWLRQNGMLQ